jgi:hypothetical protein
MRALLLIAATAAFLAGNANAQPAPTCILTHLIDHTKAPDDRTILFYMKDGTVYQSALRNNCPGLRINGFGYVSNPADQLCPNLQSVRVLRSGGVCMMGPLTTVPATPPK